ncbi:ferric reductase NAD binding domain-containing protein [Schizophyllum commune]
MVWLTHPIMAHSSRERGAIDHSSMTDEQAAMITAKWLDWYHADWDYGQTTIAFFCAGIGAATLLYAEAIVVNELASRQATRPTILERLVAGCRYASARQYRVHSLGWYSPPLAAILVVAAMTIFVFALMLAVRPYYWPNMAMGHSMPIATRSGWIAIAIMPFMIVFATKVNFVGMLTGVSHERLQIFHRWSAVLMYIPSLVHTFPFIVMNIREGTMVTNWETSVFYWTGVAALIPQTYLVFLSWGVFRNKYYEIFKKFLITKYSAAGIFMAALFVHVNFRLSSWDYFFGTAAAWALAWLIRFARSIYNSGFTGLPATLDVLSAPEPDTLSTPQPDTTNTGLVRVRINASHRVRPAAGQHVFLRFLGAGVHSLTSHPFTIAGNSDTRDGSATRELEVVFRVHGGTTAALAARAAGKVGLSMRVLVDGPYGGVPVTLAPYDRVLLLAGGSGVTFTLPLLQNLARALKAAAAACKRVDFVVAVKSTDSQEWFQDQLTRAQSLAPPGILRVSIHVTHEDKPAKETPESSSDNLLAGRPNLPRIVHDAARETRGRLAIAACGPLSFLYDVRGAVADEELTIFDGYGHCREIYLHAENFGYVLSCRITISKLMRWAGGELLSCPSFSSSIHRTLLLRYKTMHMRCIGALR